MMLCNICHVSLLLLGLTINLKAEDVLVTVQQGSLQGSTATSVYNTSYTAFLGVPYAEPPVGELRFQDPQPAGSWEGVRNATSYGSDCVQSSGDGSEDCLYLNVFVPGVPEEGAGLPVLFWVHGGGFVVGSGSDQEHGPDFLVSYGVILVTINYRLGPLGFLSTGDEVVPGNAGVKDQHLALTWVKQNIASFGGDPDLVTLQGQSAGGMAVSLHLVSPLSSGLFSRLIIQSGNFIGSSAPLEAARRNAFRLGAALGFETDDSQQLVDFLRSVNATDLLVDSSLILTDEEKLLYSYALWSPHIEAEHDGAFISEPPIQPLIDGRFLRVPIMTGVTSGENSVTHSGELPFLFLRKDTEYNLDPNSEEDKVRRNILRYWTNFAKYGTPTPEADPIVWEPYNNSNRSYMLMQANFSLAHDKNAERMDFWNTNVPLQPYADEL
ncbi:pyrethroid hydrolase Ces2e-like isoform X7 [Schistocerca serialis cubense]|uniref:pyrethroid hydrolase Ces2e-like isoform X7 n=1 Tax=Schistocerca serialis cubense TaxID=2023355 RepID=UPI00214E8045|nr:pyrethroid hydrolase Ces2e-like isoform X7 [Schistocerca serialis cubense]